VSDEKSEKSEKIEKIVKIAGGICGALAAAGKLAVALESPSKSSHYFVFLAGQTWVELLFAAMAFFLYWVGIRIWGRIRPAHGQRVVWSSFLNVKCGVPIALGLLLLLNLVVPFTEFAEARWVYWSGRVWRAPPMRGPISTASTGSRHPVVWKMPINSPPPSLRP
jgi:hypothetical protein